MKEEIKITPHGFKLPPKRALRKAERAGFKFGAAGGVQGAIINPSGDWTQYWPAGEIQSATDDGRFFETNACTVYGTENATEAIINKKYGGKPNYSERALAIYAGIDPHGGADPHSVGDKARELGFVSDYLLPFDESIRTLEQFYSPKPLPPKIINDGANWKIAHSFNHETIFSPDDNLTPLEKEAKLKEALTKGAVCVSVFAWRKNSQGLYSKQITGQADNHWTGLMRYDDKNPICGDSYPPYEKKLAPGYNFDYAMIYYVDEPNVQTIGKLQQLLTALKQLLALLLKQSPSPTPAPVPAPVPVPPPAPKPNPIPMSKLYTYAKSLIGTDASPKDLVKDGVGCAESVSTILRKLIPTFPIVTGTWSLYDALRSSVEFSAISEANGLLPGDIILCVTGQGNANVPNGHVGILGENGGIMSNNSQTGLWDVHYTMESWKAYFVAKGGYPIHYFRQRS
jgi:hypothetical protein